MKRILACILSVLLCAGLCGCDAWMDGSYYSYTPHLEDNSIAQEGSVEVSSYLELRDALVALVAEGGQNALILIDGISSDQLSSNMNNAVRYVTQENAIGAYAVEKISYEIGTSTGRVAIAVDVSYTHSRSEILRIKKTANMTEAQTVIAGALENCDAGVVLQVDSFEGMDFTQLIEDHVDANPHVCMEMPQVSAVVYPESGDQRVIELSFTYQNSREDLRQMQEYVEPLFVASDLNVRGEDSESTKFNMIYSFLMERADYQIQTSITPSYSLLRYGVGDSKAFAVVYAAMCSRAGLDCRVVTGTRAGVPWVWNLICQDGVYYHVDLLQSSGMRQLYIFEEDEMQGYVWDYSAYPASGTPAE